MGLVDLRSGLARQVEKDFLLVQGKQVEAAEWHFFPGKTGVGPTPALRPFSNKHNIWLATHK